jgi:carboxypeptidase C (cathepsin A)
MNAPMTLKVVVVLVGMVWSGWAVAQEPAAYTATAGIIAIGEDPERPDAELFHVAYTQDGADPATRPVTFLVNGGPGGSNIFLHIAAVGPLTIATAGDGTFPPVPARLEPNPDSWIDFTDLVFIDPVGTGYSRMLPGSDGQPGDPTTYYAVDRDMHSIAWFIRQWLTANDRWGSPKALAGESYGGQRVSGLSRILAESYGINLNRAVLISPALHTEIPDTRYSILGPVTIFPTQAAIAAHHGLNGQGTGIDALAEFDRVALGELTTGLATLGRSDAAAREAFYASVAAMIGLDHELVARERARIDDRTFASTLLQDRGLVLDRYVGTVAVENPIPEVPGLNTFDRSIAVLTGVLLPPFMDYVRGASGT